MPPRRRETSGHPGRGEEDVQIRPVDKMAFIQGVMSTGILSESSAKDLFARISGLETVEAYNAMLSLANQEMIYAGFELKTLKSPIDNVRHLGFINKDADEASKLGTKLTVPQREFFKTVIEYIARKLPDPIGSASETELINIEVTPSQQPTAAADGQATQGGAGPSTQSAPNAAHKTLSKQQRVSTLHGLLCDGWLAGAPNKSNYYCLGVRTYMELSDFLLGLEGLHDDTRTAFENLL